MKVISLVIAITGALVIAGWIAGFTPILGLGETVTMKPATALAFVMLGFCGWISLSKLRPQDRPQFVVPLSIGMVAITGVGLLGYLPSQLDSALHTTGPGIPSLGTMACFTLCAAKYLLALRGNRKASIAASALSTTLAAVAVVGYAIDQPAMFYWVEGVSTGMAVHTAGLFLLDGINTLRVARTASGDHSTQGNAQ